MSGETSIEMSQLKEALKEAQDMAKMGIPMERQIEELKEKMVIQFETDKAPLLKKVTTGKTRNRPHPLILL